MAKKAYIGVDNLARKIKKGYIGIEGVARKIRKAYIGIGGVARPCWGGELTYYGEITGLSVARGALASASVGKYALFAGGVSDISTNIPETILFTYISNAVDVYDKTLTHSLAPSLTLGRSDMSGATVGGYALFAGGWYTWNNLKLSNRVEIYSQNLTKISADNSDLLEAKRFIASTTIIGNDTYAVFAGGQKNLYDSTAFKTVDAYNKSLTHYNPQSLSDTRGSLAAAMVRVNANASYALFAGGFSHTKLLCVGTVDVYDNNLTRMLATPLSVRRRDLVGANVGKYALFAGGYNQDDTHPSKNTVEVYDSSLTRISSVNGLVDCHGTSIVATSLGNYVLFVLPSATERTVNAYDDLLVLTTPFNLKKRRGESTATSVEDYALFAGGEASDGFSSVVEVITV